MMQCSDVTNPFWGILDFSVAPPLLFYAYIPIALFALIFGVFVLFKDKKSLKSIILFLVTASFFLLILNEIIQWVAIHVNVVHFGWQMSVVLQTLVLYFVAYFVYVFTLNKDLSLGKKILSLIPVLPILILLPTKYNISSFDIIECQSSYGYLSYYLYIVEVIATVLIGFFLFDLYRKTKDNNYKNKIIVYLSPAVLIFLTIFVVTNIIGDSTFIYEVNLWGPLGMLGFIILMTIMIVKTQVFSFKLLAIQAFVVALNILIASQFFFVRNNTNKILTGITLAPALIIGYLMIKSVKRLDEQKLALEKANTRLAELNRQKTEFVSFATHQLRAPLTSMRGYASLILEGDMGGISDESKKAIETIYSSTNTLASVVDDYLNVSSIELGTMKYNMTYLDISSLISKVIEELKPNIVKAGLSIDFHKVEGQSYYANADENKLNQVFSNIIDNAVKYTKKGGIDIKIENANGKVKIIVKDTGVGISVEEMSKLFSKFVRVSNASETNIKGTGLGLFIAKEIIKAHQSKIWAESEGEGKGSTFLVEIPATK